MALTKITPQMFDTSATTHDLNVDNGTFVVDGSASRVGIGTATPSTLLDVNGTLTATTIAGTTSVTTADFRYSGGAGYLTYALNQAGTDTLNIRRYGTVQQQFTQYGVNFPSGSVGINNSLPDLVINTSPSHIDQSLLLIIPTIIPEVDSARILPLELSV